MTGYLVTTRRTEGFNTELITRLSTEEEVLEEINEARSNSMRVTGVYQFDTADLELRPMKLVTDGFDLKLEYTVVLRAKDILK